MRSGGQRRHYVQLHILAMTSFTITDARIIGNFNEKLLISPSRPVRGPGLGAGHWLEVNIDNSSLQTEITDNLSEMKSVFQ